MTEMTWIYLIIATSAFCLTAVAERILIPIFRSKKMGQKILDIGPRWHKNKEGTPTMGGIMFIPVIALVAILLSIPEMAKGNFGCVFVFVFALVFGIIGWRKGAKLK